MLLSFILTIMVQQLVRNLLLVQFFSRLCLEFTLVSKIYLIDIVRRLKKNPHNQSTEKGRTRIVYAFSIMKSYRTHVRNFEITYLYYNESSSEVYLK